MVVHDSERLGMQYARTLFLRGFPNVHLLKGSVKEFAQYYPDLMLGDRAEHAAREARS